MSKTIGSKEYNEWLNSPLTKALKRSFEQSITDPENQPSQYGTVTLEYMEAMIQKAGEVMRERCACSMEDYLDDPMLSGHGYANGAGMEIRALPGVTLQDLQNKSEGFK